MSIGFFILGIIIAAIGFMAVWKTDWFVKNMGDFSSALGLSNAMWMSWKVFGMVLMLIGFLVAFGLLQLFFSIVLGRLFSLGGF